MMITEEFDSILSAESFIISIRFNCKSKKFLRKQKSTIRIDEVYRLIVNSVKKLSKHNVNIDVKELKGKLQGIYRTRKGNIRIIFEYYKGQIHIINIETIDFRGDLY